MRMPEKKKIILVGFILVLVGLFFAFNLDQYMRLSFLQESRETFQALYAQHTVLVLGGFFLLYVGVTALSLPGAAVMTLAAGALFGFWAGLVLISFASTMGGTLACIVARYLFRDWAREKLGSWLNRIDSGIRREGSFYLLTLRLIPVVPFFLINLGMALTSMRMVTFYWISQVGMLPGTAVYINAGKQLGEISSTSDIFSADLIISFVILGLFPLAVKKIVNLIRTKLGKGAITPDGEPGGGSKDSAA
ncbi:MAG: TVP38/TMEM64 family protein [Desulfohalobiaceae bacterium]|nr:TVP38/TMEM64 family protein [Desulfohalobiaceae bacterium]